MTKIKQTRDLNEIYLAPIILHLSENYGSMTKFAAAYNKGLETPVKIGTLQKWLTSKRETAMVPSGESMLRILEVWREMRRVEKINFLDAEIFCVVHGHTAPKKSGKPNCTVCGSYL